MVHFEYFCVTALAVFVLDLPGLFPADTAVLVPPQVILLLLLQTVALPPHVRVRLFTLHQLFLKLALFTLSFPLLLLTILLHPRDSPAPFLQLLFVHLQLPLGLFQLPIDLL